MRHGNGSARIGRDRHQTKSRIRNNGRKRRNRVFPYRAGPAFHDDVDDGSHHRCHGLRLVGYIISGLKYRLAGVVADSGMANASFPENMHIPDINHAGRRTVTCRLIWLAGIVMGLLRYQPPPQLRTQTWMFDPVSMMMCHPGDTTPDSRLRNADSASFSRWMATTRRLSASAANASEL